MTKTAVISGLILAAIEIGSDVREAVDSVLGDGTYEQVASDVYEALRRKAN